MKFKIQSDEEDLAEEEAIAVMSQKEKAKSLSMEDFGLEDVDEEESDDEEQEKSFQVLNSLDLPFKFASGCFLCKNDFERMKY